MQLPPVSFHLSFSVYLPPITGKEAQFCPKAYRPDGWATGASSWPGVKCLQYGQSAATLPQPLTESRRPPPPELTPTLPWHPPRSHPKPPLGPDPSPVSKEPSFNHLVGGLNPFPQFPEGQMNLAGGHQFIPFLECS